jgi:hypothetical protein
MTCPGRYRPADLPGYWNIQVDIPLTLYPARH